MKIAVLDLTTHPLPLLAGQPRVGAQVIGWARQGLPRADFVCHDIAEGGAPLPAPEDFDGLILSGSEFGVYDETPWMAPLRALLLATRAAGKPIFGICFGHQIMADTFGGRAERAHDPILGARRYTFGGRAVDVHVWHQDQVTAVPPGARVTGSADYCPVGALEYDFPAASVQFHPEYSEAHLRTLFDLFLGTAVSEEARAAALASFEGAQVAPDVAAAELAALFDSPSGD